MANTFKLEADVTGDVDLQAGSATTGMSIVGTADAADALRTIGDLKYLSTGVGTNCQIRVTLNRLTLDGESAGVYTGGISNIPTGFNPVTAQINVETNLNGGSEAFVNANCVCYVQSNIATQTQLVRSGVNVVPTTVTLTPSGAVNLFADGLGWTYLETGAGTSADCLALYITGTYTIDAWQFYLERIDEEHDGIKFKKDKLTQVLDGDAPPDGAIPFGEPNVAPTYEWWEYDDGDILLYLYQPVSPGTSWTIVGSPTDYGWWKSFEEFQGGALLVVNANPKKPRTFEEIEDYSDFMGGFPGCGTVYNYKLVYAGRDYADEPVMRIFDGLSDRELCRVPPVSGTDSVAIISVATVNGTIYITTFDSGDGTTDSGGPSYTGRVFELDVPSASLTLIGAQFTGGQLPYALAWHNGMLWCGTNPSGDASEGGKIYYFRPGVDTVWTEDHDLDTNSMGGCTGLASFQGKLVATTVSPSGDSAEVLSRAIDGTWSTIATGSGTAALNAYGSPTVYNDTLYVTYFDSTFGSRIYSYDGATFTSVLTSSYSDHAFIGLYLGSGNIYALGGGFELDAILYGSEDGTTWDDLTDFLPGQATQKATPVFAEVRTA